MNTIFKRGHEEAQAALEQGFTSRSVESRTWGEVIKILSMKDIGYIVGGSVSTGELANLLVSKEVGISLGAMVFLISFVTSVVKNTIDRGLQKRE